MLKTDSNDRALPWQSVSEEQWNDWRWQLANKLRVRQIPKEGATATQIAAAREELSRIEEVLGFSLCSDAPDEIFSLWGVEISPHLALHIRNLVEEGKEDWARRLATTVLPSDQELNFPVLSENIDGMGVEAKREACYQDMPRPIRRLYKDRCLLFVSMSCPVLCRYCFRKFEAGRPAMQPARNEIDEALQYIENWNASRPYKDQIHDVILSGGDPLSLADDRLAEVLARIRQIDGIELIRIDSKFLAAIPQRITPQLVDILRGREEGPTMIVTCHFTSPGEFSPETVRACRRLAQAGILLGNYTPLLRGVNDDRDILKALFTRMLGASVRPYYLVSLIETRSALHFQVPLERGQELLRGLHWELSGYAIPRYICYLPGGGGKVFIDENNPPGTRTDEGWIITGEDGLPHLYHDSR